MTNAKHSSASVEWYTPNHIIELVRSVLGSIDLDPCSSELANEVVKATTYFTYGALERHWGAVEPLTCYVNPPGGKIGNQSQTKLFWDHLIKEKNKGHISHAIFMGFSIECLAVCQNSPDPITNYPVCIPRKRICFESNTTKKHNPTHNNAIVYVPGTINRTQIFEEVFADLGGIMMPY